MTDVATSSVPSELDLAFIIDATSSMSSYIASAQEVCMFVGNIDDLKKTSCRICGKLFKILLRANDVY